MFYGFVNLHCESTVLGRATSSKKGSPAANHFSHPPAVNHLHSISPGVASCTPKRVLRFNLEHPNQSCLLETGMMSRTEGNRIWMVSHGHALYNAKTVNLQRWPPVNVELAF